MKASTAMLVIGVLLILGGIFALANPLAASIAVTTLVGAMFLVAGILQAWVLFQDIGAEHRLWNGFIALLTIVAGVWLLTNPLAGTVSLTLILGGVFVFVLALVILGYLISTVARTQMQAMQLTFFFFLPSLMLSGFMFPYRGMPGWAQTLGEIFPLTHFLRLIRSVMLKGADAATVAQSFLALFLFVIVLAAVALRRFRQTLD